MRYTISKDGRAQPAPSRKTLAGGYREGSGRKPVSDDGAASATLTVRVTPEQKAKVMALGGSEWVRMMIDAARVQGVK